jgi:CCR4-NOT transcription complex subunit 3
MEKFKACEKEMKTKAFSKEGLTQVRLDPKAQERSDTISWLQNMVDELSMQTETAEAEVETLQGGTKKKGKGGGANERLERLEHMNERRKWHVSRLELILRLMENGSLPTEKVLDIKEDVQYFVDSNTVGILAYCPSVLLTMFRMTISRKMKAYTMTLILKKWKVNLV